MSISLPVHVVVNPALVTPEALPALMEKLADFAPVLEEVGGIVEQEIGENFTSQGFGTWAPLADSTVRERFRSGHGPNAMLVRSGDLEMALRERGAPGHKFLVDADSVTVGVYGDVIPYASYLAHGTSRMPARVLIQLRPEAIDAAIAAITEWLGGGPGVRVFADAPLEA